MRTDKYVTRLIEKSQDKKTDPQALARMIDLTLRKVTETHVGEQAFMIIKQRIVRDAFRSRGKRTA